MSSIVLNQIPEYKWFQDTPEFFKTVGSTILKFAIN